MSVHGTLLERDGQPPLLAYTLWSDDRLAHAELVEPSVETQALWEQIEKVDDGRRR